VEAVAKAGYPVKVSQERSPHGKGLLENTGKVIKLLGKAKESDGLQAL